MQRIQKKTYTTPSVVVYGNVEEITQGTADGAFTDAVFPVKTPKDQITFS